MIFIQWFWCKRVSTLKDLKMLLFASIIVISSHFCCLNLIHAVMNFIYFFLLHWHGVSELNFSRGLLCGRIEHILASYDLLPELMHFILSVIQNSSSIPCLTSFWATITTVKIALYVAICSWISGKLKWISSLYFKFILLILATLVLKASNLRDDSLNGIITVEKAITVDRRDMAGDVTWSYCLQL